MTAPHPEPAVATHTVRVFNLRLWLPLSLIIASAVMALILVADQQRHYAQDLQRFPTTRRTRNCWKPSGPWRPFCAAAMAAVRWALFRSWA